MVSVYISRTVCSACTKINRIYLPCDYILFYCEKGEWETSGRKKKNRQASTGKAEKEEAAPATDGWNDVPVQNTDKDRTRSKSGGPPRLHGRHNDSRGCKFTIWFLTNASVFFFSKKNCFNWIMQIFLVVFILFKIDGTMVLICLSRVWRISLLKLIIHIFEQIFWNSSFDINVNCVFSCFIGRGRENKENERNLEDGNQQDRRERRGFSSGAPRGGGGARGRGGGRAGGRYPPRGNRTNSFNSSNNRPMDTWDTWESTTITNSTHTNNATGMSHLNKTDLTAEHNNLCKLFHFYQFCSSLFITFSFLGNVFVNKLIDGFNLH